MSGVTERGCLISDAAREAYAKAFAGIEPNPAVIGRIALLIAPAVRALRAQRDPGLKQQDAA